eukprot:1144800-Pelagomonas_calceolata.AAC.3
MQDMSPCTHAYLVVMQDMSLVSRHMSGPGMFPLARWRLLESQIRTQSTAAAQNAEWHFRRHVQNLGGAGASQSSAL